MIVSLSATSADVVEADDCTRLHVATSLSSGTADAALRASGIGRLDPGGEALLDLETLRTRARADAREPGWDEKWSKMIDYARGKGWVTDAAVRAHVEYGASA
ncbi:hypothetical protein Acsp06_60030 [Actinomycetospora sp. NBRC 106375]|uniref:hypothetical protein n=1 Tax=Actinomycetospora sp. NBRC 106375 TaxID=3032207 RepID=UPI0024A5E461|nr:hypothetical protein [Actinomycetospora sp. NBRC 106375]GLZ49818.1 hypothetical protein Acsp06_60030 [Actinomycetospora sp. NBRC 106375]